MKYKILFLFIFFNIQANLFSQILDSATNQELDSIFIHQIQEVYEPDKVLHAEPLYIDLIRDLGARKGEKEWNLATGITDNLSFDTYEFLVEYEFAPINRLGFEIELPFEFIGNDIRPRKQLYQSPLKSIKLATQYTFLVSQKNKTSMAIGYIHEFLVQAPVAVASNFNGHSFNPFFIAAKRWGNNLHTLIYTGPIIESVKYLPKNNTHYEINTNLHYMVSGTRNFVGIELNKAFYTNDFDMTIRPQMRLGIADNFLIGIVGGIPIDRENQRFSMFTRIIWEPGHKHDP